MLIALSLVATMPLTKEKSNTSPSSHVDIPAPIPIDESSRLQPWKQHWPPKEGTEKAKAYGFKKGTRIVIYGN